MPARRNRSRTYFAFLWLSLATIFAHALLPAGSPLARVQGSAFSFATTDVSLAPKRRDAAVKDVAQSRTSRPDDANAGSNQFGPKAALFAAAPLSLLAPGPVIAGAIPARGTAPDLYAAYRARAPPAI